jgi:hypothetical protein
MAILSNAGNTYSSGDPVTAANLNAQITGATFEAGDGEAADGTTIQVHPTLGYLKIKDGGVDTTQLAAGAVTGGDIGANEITSTNISSTDGQFLVDGASTQKTVVINEAGEDVDFRVEGDNDANLIVTDGENDVVGIGGTNTSYKLNVEGPLGVTGLLNIGQNAPSSSAAIFFENTSATGNNAIFRWQTNLTGSIATQFHADLQSDYNRMVFQHTTNDQVGLLILNTNAGDGTGSSVAPVHDNKTSSGTSARRWSIVHTVGGTTTTSDENYKTDIEDLSEAELRVATAIKGLVKKFKMKGGTRTHVGVIAQDVKAAFEAEGLDAHKYGLFCYDEWEDEETGEKKSLYSIRYEELLAFVIAAL